MSRKVIRASAVTTAQQVDLALASGARGIMAWIALTKTTITSGTATGGSTTTLVDTTKDFVTLGVAIGDQIVTSSGPGTGQTLTVTNVAATTLTFAAATALGAGTVYEVNRPVSGNAIMKVQIKEAATDTYSDVIATAAVTALNTPTRLIVYPGATPAANSVSGDFMPTHYRIVVTPSDAGLKSYTVGVAPLN